MANSEETQHFRKPSAASVVSGNNILIRGGSFNQLNHWQAITFNAGLAESSNYGLLLLSAAIAAGAIHDSCERYPPVTCGPHEHIKVRKEILTWTEDPNSPTNIIWVSGGPNTGKTAIAQSIAESLFQSGNLAGSFFFNRTKVRQDNAHHLFLTLAYQIATNFPGMREPINNAVCRDPTLLTKSSGRQLESLIVKPFQDLMTSGSESPPISTIVIDALDECGSPAMQRDILMFILRYPRIPLRFLIFSRREEHINETFNGHDLFLLVQHIQLDDHHEEGDNTNTSSSSINHSSLFSGDTPAGFLFQSSAPPPTITENKLSKKKVPFSGHTPNVNVSAIVARRAIHGTSSPHINLPLAMDISPTFSPRLTIENSPHFSPSLSMKCTPDNSPASMMNVDLSPVSMKTAELSSPSTKSIPELPSPTTKMAFSSPPSTVANLSSPSTRIIELSGSPSTRLVDLSPALSSTAMDMSPRFSSYKSL